MKDVVLDEGIPTKFLSYFWQLYFIWYEFSKVVNRQVKLESWNFGSCFSCSANAMAGVGATCLRCSVVNSASQHRTGAGRGKEWRASLGEPGLETAGWSKLEVVA
jgi:hypothetical protein